MDKFEVPNDNGGCLECPLCVLNLDHHIWQCYYPFRDAKIPEIEEDIDGIPTIPTDCPLRKQSLTISIKPRANI